jgi:hypothetical protein
MSGDGIEARITTYVNVHPAPPSIRIGDEVLVFPPGTTNEEAQSVLDEAKRIYLAEKAGQPPRE